MEYLARAPTAPATHPRAKFSTSEDEQLKVLVEEHGTTNWHLIAALMPGRNTRQVRERWFNYLKPDLNQQPWSEEEEKLLLDLHEQYGNKWKQIAAFFEKRTDINVKSKYHKLERKIRKQQKKAMKQLMQNGASPLPVPIQTQAPQQEGPKYSSPPSIPQEPLPLPAKYTESFDYEPNLGEATYNFLASETFMDGVDFTFDEQASFTQVGDFDWF